jgi:hypothetical protein
MATRERVLFQVARLIHNIESSEKNWAVKTVRPQTASTVIVKTQKVDTNGSKFQSRSNHGHDRS